MDDLTYQILLSGVIVLFIFIFICLFIGFLGRTFPNDYQEVKPNQFYPRQCWCSGYMPGNCKYNLDCSKK